MENETYYMTNKKKTIGYKAEPVSNFNFPYVTYVKLNSSTGFTGTTERFFVDIFEVSHYGNE